MKRKKLIIIILLAILIVIATLIVSLNILNDKQRLSVNEKQWLNANKNNVISINVINDLNVFGKDGNGVFFEFLNSLSENYNIEVNPVIYNSDEHVDGTYLGYSLTKEILQVFMMMNLF